MLEKLILRTAEAIFLFNLKVLDKAGRSAEALTLLLEFEEMVLMAGYNVSPRVEEQIRRRCAERDGFDRLADAEIETALEAAAAKDGF